MTAPLSPLPYREGGLLLFFQNNRSRPARKYNPAPSIHFCKQAGSRAKPPPIRGRVASPHKHPTFLLLFLRFGSTNAPPRSPTHIQKALLQFKRKSPTLTMTKQSTKVVAGTRLSFSFRVYGCLPHSFLLKSDALRLRDAKRLTRRPYRRAVSSKLSLFLPMEYFDNFRFSFQFSFPAMTFPSLK